MNEPSVLDYLKARLAVLAGRGDGEARQRLLEIETAAGLRGEPVTGQPALAPAESRPRAAPDVELPEAAPAPEQPWLAGDAAPEAAPAPESPPRPAPEPAPELVPEPAPRRAVPLRSLIALLLALLAQAALEPPASAGTGALLYLLASLFAGWAFFSGELRPGPAAPARPLPDGERAFPVFVYRPFSLLVSIPLLMWAFFLFGGNRFTGLNLFFWALGVFFFLRGFWEPAPHRLPWYRRLAAFLAQREWTLRLTPWSLALLGAAALALFYRFYRLDAVPPEMISDHAEKLLDVYDVLAGQTSIFFPRNTGREALQMYLTAAIARYLGTGISYLSLKIGTALAGLLTLPFIYLLGKEAAGRRAGLLALVLAGMAYWPNVISRVGLRFPLYALFAAPTLFFLARGLRRGSRNDFILAGLALGVGLHGYTPMRIVPFVVVFAVGLHFLHRLGQIWAARRRAGEGEPVEGPSPYARQFALSFQGLLLVALVSLVIFLPLLRFWLESPELFAFRSFSRLGPVERELPGPALPIFLNNVWRAAVAPIWDDGEIWVNSVTHRPALDVVSGALYVLGSLLVLLRYLRRRHWLDLFLLLSIPLLMLPSSLSLAFPDENPALNRMSAAVVPIFVICGMALDALLSALEGRARPQAAPAPARPRPAGAFSLPPALLSAALALALLFLSARQNYDLVFNQYYTVFRDSSWNSSEMGKVIAQFAGTVGRGENAWVVAYPHWVDTRLVGIHAGFPLRDFAIWPENLAETQAAPGPKLFLVRPDDTAGLETLVRLYPQGALQEYQSEVQHHNFLIFFVPG